MIKEGTVPLPCTVPMLSDDGVVPVQVLSYLGRAAATGVEPLWACIR